jgi:AAA domain
MTATREELHGMTEEEFVDAVEFGAGAPGEHVPTIGPAVAVPRTPWLIDVADLLAEPDPGPTPMLVEDLIVDKAIIAAVGRWKTTKSYGLLDLCIAVATGRPAFGKLAIPTAGPVVFVNEESGRTALWRRLDALCRGRAIDPEELRGRLHVAANARIRLDDLAWQKDLIEMGQDLRPRLMCFDPLARMKAPGREENAQSGMAVPIEFIRKLRETTQSAVAFVHHTGHTGDQMRGSSDLESVWETRLAWKRDGQSQLVTIESEHREAESADAIQYRIGWDHDTRTMRFDLVDDRLPELRERIVAHLSEHPNQTTDQVREAVGVRRSDVKRTLEDLEKAGTTRDKVWNLASAQGLWPVP